MLNFLLFGPIQDSLILDICINRQIFILQLQNVIVDMFNKNMSLGSLKISICPFYLLLPFFFSQLPSNYKHQELLCECQF